MCWYENVLNIAKVLSSTITEKRDFAFLQIFHWNKYSMKYLNISTINLNKIIVI